MLDLGFIKILSKKEFRKLKRQIIDSNNQVTNLKELMDSREQLLLSLSNDKTYLGTTIDEQKKEIEQLKALLTINFYTKRRISSMEVEKKLHNRRLLTEYSELLIIKTKLRLYLDRLEVNENTLPENEKINLATMREQLNSMEEYLFTLEKRLQIALDCYEEVV